MNKPYRPILCLDFDGVIHSYKSPWVNARTIPDPPVKMAAWFLLSALNRFDVKVLSSRSHQWGGRKAMRKFCGQIMHEEAVNHLMAGWLPAPVRKIFDEGAMDSAEEIDWELGGLIGFPWFKPPSHVMLDDRAITFTGEWPDLLELTNFKPWNRK